MNNLKKLQSRLLELGLDAMLITEPMNRKYLSGFTGSNGVIIVGCDEVKMVTDYRYVEQARRQTNGMEVILHEGHTGHKGRIFVEVANQVKRMGVEKLGFEQNHVTYGFYEKFKALFSVQLVPTSEVIETMRMVKSREEIELLRTSAKITDEAFAQVIEYVRAGVTEMEISNKLENFIKEKGATSSTFMPIVASGYRSALPHGRASEKVIENGDMVTIDFGCNYNGYWSDISRTIAVGKQVDELVSIYKVVRQSFDHCVKSLRPGISDQEVDSLMRKSIKSAGLDEFSGTGTGHGIGLEVHELPLFSVLKDKELKPGMVITVEPGIYIPEIGGVRLEDVILITEDGCEVLTPSTKELIIN